MDGEFLRRKGRTLERLARACFDLDTARQLRLLADEFHTRADLEDDAEGGRALRSYGGERENGGLGQGG